MLRACGPAGARPRYITLQNANQTKMIRLSSIMFWLLLAFSLGSSANAQPKTQKSNGTPRTIERGRFRFYETKQLRGEETYEIRADANGELTIQAKTQLPFAEQEKKPLSIVTFTPSWILTRRYATPLMSFETKVNPDSRRTSSTGIVATTYRIIDFV